VLEFGQNEIIFRRPHPSKLCLTPPTLYDVELVSSAKLLGIYFTDKMHEYVWAYSTYCFCV